MKKIDMPTESILNLKTVRDFMFYNVQGGFDRLTLLTQNNKENFLKLFGRQTFTWASEFRHWIWDIDFCGYTFRVFTGNKGTAYEIYYTKGVHSLVLNKKIPEVAAEFMKYIEKKLLEVREEKS